MLKQARDKSDLFAAAAAAELLRGGTKPPGHHHWKVIGKLTAISVAQIVSPPLPRQTQGMGAQEEDGEKFRKERRGPVPFPKGWK